MTKIINCIDEIISSLCDIKKEIREQEKKKETYAISVDSISQYFKQIRNNNKKDNREETAFIQKTNKENNIKEGINAKMTKRKDGRYMARFYISAGVYKYVYGKTKQECNEKLVKAIKEYEEFQQKNTLSPKIKLKDYINYYYEKISSIKETSRKIYDFAIEQICTSKYANKQISTITLDDLLNLVDSIKLFTNRKNAIIVLKTAFAKALEIGIIKYNYASLLKVEENQNKVANEHKYIYLNEIDNCLQQLKLVNSHYALLFLVLVYTGVRIGEALALTWDDFDFQNKTIKINKQFATTTGKIEKVKSKSSNRIVPILPQLENELLKIESSSNATSIFEEYQKDENFRKSIAPITPHDLRHTFATNCFLVGVNSKQTQKWLGHSNYSMTIDTYTHLPKISDKELVRLKDTFKEYL